MQLDTERDGRQDVSGVGELCRILETLDLDGNSFAILSKGDETYLQTAPYEDGFAVERRDGSHLTHFCAVKAGDAKQDRFSPEEMSEIFSAYLLGSPQPAWVDWQRMAMPDPKSLLAKAGKPTLVALLAFFALLTVYLAWMRLS